MNKELGRDMSIEETKIRGWVRKIIDQPGSLNEVASYSPQEAYRMFVEPFADVFSVAKVGLTDILSSAKLNLDVFLSISPKSIKEAEQKWEGRKQAIDSKYDALMQKIDQAGGDDAKLFAFLFNPAVYLASAAAGSISAGGGVREFLKDSGLTTGLPSGGGGSGGGGSPGGSSPAGDSGPGLLGKLKSIFFLPEGYNADLELITEDKDPDASKIEKELQDLGVLEEISEDAKVLYNIKKEIIETLVPEVEKRSNFIMPIYNATTPEEFKVAVDRAKSSGLEFDGLSEVGKQMDAAVKKTLADQAAIEKVKDALAGADKLAEADKEPSDDVIRSKVEEAVFMGSIQPLREKIYDSMEKLKKDVGATITKGVPEDNNLGDTKLGKSLLELIQGAERALSNL